VWHQNWGGDTVFYNRDETDILTSVFPRPGRAVTFHGAIPHSARAPSRDCSELRVSLVIKTQKCTEAVASSTGSVSV
jgi:SM-20-related protein